MDQLNRAVGRIYEAAVDPGAWTQALAEIVAFVGNSGSHLFLMNDVSGLVGESAHFGMPDRLMAEYNGEKITACPRLANARAHPDRLFLYDYQHIDEREIDTNEYYDWLRHRGDGIRYYLGGRLTVLDDVEGYLSLAFRASEGHAQQRHLQRAQRVLGHVSQAIRIGQQLAGWKLAAEGSLASLDALDVAVLLLDAQGRVLHVNRLAEALARTGDLYDIVSRRLRLHRFAEAPAVQRMIGEARTALAEGRPFQPAAVHVQSARLGAEFEVTAAPFRPAGLVSGGDAASVAVLWRRRRMLERLNPVLQLRFGLTPAEWRLTQALCQGLALTEAARLLGISHHTARSHLRAIYGKTATRHQVQLVALLLRET